ncbi:hypothetical protein J4455_03810 [Candidatus Woesearchaeota archaeon]|nr:hypothetical protein [Candidatus Woesearchaeota archaeon]
MKIGVDLDEVLVEFINPFLDYLAKDHSIVLKKEQITTYRLWELWNGSKAQGWQLFIDFYKKMGVINLKPVELSENAIDLLQVNHDLMVITSRPRVIKNDTEFWVNKYFNGKFKEIHFADYLIFHGKKKAEICKDLKIDVMIEDSLEYAEECSKSVKKVFLLNQPWNQSDDLPENIERVYSWGEIINKIN